MPIAVKATFLFCVACFYVLTSCKEVTFKVPQPKDKKSLPSVPKMLRGKYLTLDENGTLSKDTVVITADGYYFGYFEQADRANPSGEYDRGTLSDTLVLRSYKGYYFLNLRDGAKWLLRVLQQEKNGDLAYMALDSKGNNFNNYLTRLSVEIPIDSTKTEKETLYQIDPTPTELITLVEKGFFSKVKLKKIK